MNKSITKNYIYNLIYQILIVPSIATPYLSRTLGTESYTLVITTNFILFGTLEMPMYGQREIAYHKKHI